MLQYILENSSNYTLPELAQMAIEGGCKWVQMRLEDMSDEDIRALASELVPLCKETSVILTIEDNLDMARELGIHGVHLRRAQVSVAQAREILGPEAIIGVEVEMAAQVMALKGVDVDYVTFSPSVPLEQVGENIESLRNFKCELPIVIEGNFNPITVADALKVGANGIAIGSAISDSKDPVAETEALVQALTT